MNTNELAQRAADVLRNASGVDTHPIAVTLGSGWRSAAEHLGETISEISAAEVPGFRTSEVAGHASVLRSVRMTNGVHALIIGARTHYYEGHGVAPVVHGVRTAAALGAQMMVLTNGAGGLDPTWNPGQPVLIGDHLNLTATSPISGATFVDLTDLYSRRLRDLALSIDSTLPEGVYAQFPGPHYETPAEVRMAQLLGADLVGMSTALEAIAAREAGLDVFGMSLVTNLAAGIQDTPLAHSEVLEAGRSAEKNLGPLLAKILVRFAEDLKDGPGGCTP